MRALLIATGLIMLTGGCATASSTTPPPAAQTPAAQPPAAQPPAAASSATAHTSSKPFTSRPTAEPAAEDCLTRNLTITDATDEGGGSAGHHTESLVFTNRAGHACTLDGFPGVSFVTGDNGTQVGTPFLRTTTPRHRLTLNPGDSVHATILIADYRNVDATACDPTTVRGYRVYPPNETAAAFVPQPQTACAAPNEATGQVQPVEPGPLTPTR